MCETACVEQRILLLTGRDGSSVVVDYLYDQDIEQDMAVACFYYDFISRKAQSPTSKHVRLTAQTAHGWAGRDSSGNHPEIPS